MWHWVEVYNGGMGACNAQLHVQKFGSWIYKSHRQVLEHLVAWLDW